MSLLLEALKKAELAKQTAKEGAPSAEPELAPPEPAARVITREKLPDISQPLEILTDDLPSSEPAGETAAAGSELSLQGRRCSSPQPSRPRCRTNSHGPLNVPKPNSFFR